MEKQLERQAAQGVQPAGQEAAALPQAPVPDLLAAPSAAALPCLQPLYLRRFVCDGSLCGSLCCCAKWGVALDEATLARCGKKPELLRELKNGIERSETGGWVMRHENERCVFLREDGLCSLQRRFGIGAISDVCAEYPRKTHRVGETLDRTLCLSCPVAAEAALLDPSPMAFEWVEHAAPRPAYVDENPLGAALSAEAFRALQLAALSLLEERRLTLDARLAALGLLLARAETYPDGGGNLERDAAAIAEAAAGQAGVLLAENPFDASLCLEFFTSLLPALAAAAEDDLPETEVRLASLRTVLGKKAGKGDLPAFLHLYGQYKEQIFRPYSYILENWLVNEFLLGRYPLMGGTGFLANYEVFVVLYKMLVFLLTVDASAYSAGKEVSPVPLILAAVRYLAVRTNHFPGYIDQLAGTIADLLPGDHLLSLLDGQSEA